MMDANEIKKALYREKPTAIKTNFKGGYSHYVTQLSGKRIVQFNVPKEESEFANEVPAQLLIRWLEIK